MVLKEELITHLLKGTSARVGEDFFKSLVKHVCLALEVNGAWVAEFDEEHMELRSRAFFIDNRFVEEYNYQIKNTPCEIVYKNKDFYHVSEQVIELFPHDPDLGKLDAVGYMGVPLFEENGVTVIGHLAVMHNAPIETTREIIDVFNLFAGRAGAELLRIKHEEATRESRDQLGKLIESAMDGIITMDESFNVVDLNTSAKRLLNYESNSTIQLSQWIHPDHRDKFYRLAKNIQSLPEGRQHGWLPKGIVLRNADRNLIQGEASLCCYTIKKKSYYSLIVRSLNDKIEAEEKISKLSSETHYLKQIIAEENSISEIIGESKVLRDVIRQVEQVAPVDSTVLIFGETGTGKELLAQAIHEKSNRTSGEFIKVNCAAIPASLIESEFFGHEKGAFTGATTKREGRFSLADKGSIFLDEIGELSLDLQSKLLRVLQEGEFEPVGSSKTKKVNVRVIAATNRDLMRMVKDGRFREDLYYRLCVFPITLPPLRERDRDCVLLSKVFLAKFSKKFGKKIDPLTPYDEQLIQSYSWPGNIRELQNVMERAVILSQSDKIHLQLSLPSQPPKTNAARPAEDQILTSLELEEVEKRNLRRAMEVCNWKVSGTGSASELLGIKPTTLSSRLKALGLRNIDKSLNDIS